MDVVICVIKEEIKIFFPYICLKIISERTHKLLQITISSGEWVKVGKREREICFHFLAFCTIGDVFFPFVSAISFA